jgi:hypothetical protein
VVKVACRKHSSYLLRLACDKETKLESRTGSRMNKDTNLRIPGVPMSELFERVIFHTRAFPLYLCIVFLEYGLLSFTLEMQNVFSSCLFFKMSKFKNSSGYAECYFLANSQKCFSRDALV